MSPELEQALRRESDTLRQENKMLKDKVHALSVDLDKIIRLKPSQEMEHELKRLRFELQEKANMNDKLNARVREMTNEKESFV
jgi:predicted RNase H-like nuclease (RuvC/YqgF family)